MNATTLDPWINPYSYATQRPLIVQDSNTYKGVLIRPYTITTIPPNFLSPRETLPLPLEPVTDSPKNLNLWEQIDHNQHENDTEIYKEEFLFPPERYKIVEENLLYETHVSKLTPIMSRILILSVSYGVLSHFDFFSFRMADQVIKNPCLISQTKG